MACPNLNTLSEYERLLERHGFVDIQTHDLSEQYADHYQKAMVRLEQAKDWMTERFSAKVFAIVMEKNSFAVESFRKRQIGGGQFLAHLPG